MYGPKIFTFDIETAPMEADVWKMWDNNVGRGQLRKDWHLLTWAGKWLHEDYVYSDALINYRDEYKIDPECDYQVLCSLWDFLDEADIVVGHNSAKFDVPKVLTRMLMHGMDLPSPVKQIDTLAIAKRKFRFTRNSLEYISRALGYEGKTETGGHELWVQCVKGNLAAYKTMLEYNENDTIITEWVFQDLVAHGGIKPSFGLYVDDGDVHCTNPACGSTSIIKKGFDYTGVSKFQRYKCKDCGNPMRGRKNLADRSNLLISVT